MPTENENQEASWLDKAKAVAKVAAPYAYNAAKNLLPFPARLLAEDVEAADNGTFGLGPALVSGALQQPVREALGMPGKQIDNSYFSPEQLEVLKRATAAHIASRGEEDHGVVNGYAANRAMNEYNHYKEHRANSNAGYFGALINNPLDLLTSTIGSYGYKKKDNGNYSGKDQFDFSKLEGRRTEVVPWPRVLMGKIAGENSDGSSKNSATQINVDLGNLDDYIEKAKSYIDPNEKLIDYVGRKGLPGDEYYEPGYPHMKQMDYRKPLK